MIGFPVETNDSIQEASPFDQPAQPHPVVRVQLLRAFEFGQLAPDLLVDDSFPFERASNEAPPPLARDLRRTTTIVFTSGTTGEPKGAVFTDDQLAAVSAIDSGGLDMVEGMGPKTIDRIKQHFQAS